VSRVVIVGGPRTGKSWLACKLGGDENGAPTRVYCGTTPLRCGDPFSVVKEPIGGVEYLPEGLPFSGDTGAAQWIVDNWFQTQGPWICEGHVMARALRRWLNAPEQYGSADDHYPCDKIIVFENQRHDCDLKRGQVAMHTGVLRVWGEIASYFEPIVEYR
jgi:hypothetical protein